MTPEIEIWDEVPATKFKLRGKQPEWITAVESDLQRFTRLLVVAPGGVGKSSVMGVLADRLWRNKGGKSLILENRDRLTEQTAQRIAVETGLDVEVEKADQRASPFCPIVVGSTQSMGRVNRLTGFSDSHFQLCVADECHFSLAPQPQRILNYFHVGAESLEENWVMPEHGLYVPKASVVGFTASPNLGAKRSLGEYYQHKSVDYAYLAAVEDGWLVGIKEINIPVKIDVRKLRVKRTAEGNDFNTADQAAIIIPIIGDLAKQIVENAYDKKTICFMPNVDCSRRMAEALISFGMDAIFVSGECLDKDEKTDRFQASGPGTVLVNCALYVYGIDFPDVSCIAIFSAVLSKVNYIQKVYRGARVLPGIVSDGMTAEQRRFAISMSKKPFMTLLSPFFISDRIDICELYDLFSDNTEVKKRLKASGDVSTEGVDKATRDWLKSIEKAAKANAHRAARVINPISWALSIGDAKLATWTPQNERDTRPVTPPQERLLRQFHMDMSKITCFGLAQMVIGVVLNRKKLGRASPGQLDMLHLLGVSDEQAALLSDAEARETIEAIKSGKSATPPTPQAPRPPAEAAPLESAVEEHW